MSGAQTEWEICILAGGTSSRMGCDKANLKIGDQTILERIRHEALKLGFPVRVLTEDIVEKCGPLGGIYTALTTTCSSGIVFLACDMPMITAEFLFKLRELCIGDALFVQSDSPGFPVLLKLSVLPVITQQIEDRSFSLNSFACRLNATIYNPSTEEHRFLFNVNTPSDLEALRTRIQKSGDRKLPDKINAL